MNFFAVVNENILANRSDINPVHLIVVIFSLALIVGTSVVVQRRRVLQATEPGDSGSNSAGLQRFDFLVFGGIALVAFGLLLPWSRGLNFPDTKLLWYFNPANGFELTNLIWDPNRNFGSLAATQQGPLYAITGTLQWIGLAPWLIQRVFFGLVLSFGGIGAAMLARELRPGRRVVMAVAGLWFILTPYSIAFLRPAGLYVYVAICPWLVLGVMRGMLSSHKWRWAALLAVVIGVAGTTNVPGLVWTLLPSVVVAVALMWAGQARMRDLVKLGWRTAVILLPMLGPGIFRLKLFSGALAANLGATETLKGISVSSSWPESLRGLGGWLVYYAPGGSPSVAGIGPFVTSRPLVLLSFLPVIVAFIVIAVRRNVTTVVIGTVLVLAGIAMVGAFPFTDPSPAGAAMKWLYSSVSVLFGLRSSFKAGGGLVLATALLLGLGADALWVWGSARLKRPRSSVRRPLTALAGLVLLSLFAVGASPYITERFFEKASLGAIPSYWGEAVDWLDQQPDSTTTLIAPFSYYSYYNWGNANAGDIFPSLMNRPYLRGEPMMSGPADSTNLVESIGRVIGDGNYRAGELEPIAQRIGIGWVIIRNDLDWWKSVAPRPALLQSLRDDPALELVATFGEPSSTTGTVDLNDFDSIEAHLPPVEIYRIGSVQGRASVISERPSMLVSGDGDAWIGMARDGELNDGDPIQYSGRLDAAEMANLIAKGASVTVTDTNLRRSAKPGGMDRSVKTADGSEPANDLFGSPDTQTVSDVGDAKEIYETVGRVLAPSPAHRPAAAFDGLDSTSWIAGTGVANGNEAIGAVLREPKVISSVIVYSETGGGTDQSLMNLVTGALLHLSDGSPPIPITFTDGVGTASFAPRSITGFEIEITSVVGTQGVPFGFSSIDIPGIDLIESLRLPLDLAKAAVSDDALRLRLTTAELQYRFQRMRSAYGPLDERLLRRKFTTPVARRFELTARFDQNALVSGDFVDSVSAAPVRAKSADTAEVAGSRAAFVTVDGDLTTGWSPKISGGTLNLTFPTRSVTSVLVTLDESSLYQVPPTISVTAGGRTTSINLFPDPGCLASSTTCPRDVIIEIPATTTNMLSLAIAANSNPLAPPVKVLEVRINGAVNVVENSQIPSICRDDLVEIDGKRIPVRMVGTIAELRSGAPISVIGCGPLELAAGTHLLETSVDATLDEIQLTASALVSGGSTGVGNDRAFLDARSSSGDGWTASIGASDTERILVSGQGFGAAWNARVGDVDLGDPVELDAQTAWVVPPASSGSVLSTSFGPQKSFDWTLLLCALAFAVAVVLLAFANTGSTVLREKDTPRSSRASEIAAIVLGLVVGFAIGSIVGVATVAIAIVLQRRGRSIAKWSGFAAAACLAAAALMTVPPFGPVSSGLTVWFARNRRVATDLGRYSAVLITVSLTCSALEIIRRERQNRKNRKLEIFASMWAGDDFGDQ